MKFTILLTIPLILTQSINGSVKLKEGEMKNEQRVALVIGNSNYKGVLSKLTNPTNDAKEIRDILKTRGFEVIYRENIGKRDTKESLKEFYAKIEKGGVGLLYFSGHGLELDGENYLIPIDAEINAKSDTEYEAISVNKITKRLEGAKNRFNIVILDACRNDPFSRAVGTGGLAKVDPPVGLFVSYSTAAGSVASDGTAGKNGLFTQYLIKNMQKKLNIQQVFKKTREGVYEASNHKQFPAIYDQTLKGEFYFTFPSVSKSIIEVEDVTSTPNYSKVTINTTPKDAIVKIAGLDERYYNGIKLENKQYEFLISKDGYGTKKVKIDLKSDVNENITLKKDKNSTPKRIVSAPKTESTGWNKKVFDGKRSYSQNTTNTVKDNYTNLIWTKGDFSRTSNWNDAMNYCKNLSLDGYKNWDLPSKKELQYLSDTDRFAPVIDTDYFNVGKSELHHWTKTSPEPDPSHAFGINFLMGGYDNYDKSEQGYVFCVNR